MKQETKQNKLDHNYFEKKKTPKYLNLCFYNQFWFHWCLLFPTTAYSWGSNFNKISWSREVNIHVA